MAKRGRVLIAFTAIAFLALLAWSLLLATSSAPEPVYNGKPLSYWLQAYNPAQNGNEPTEAEANVAINEIGTDAIPPLLRMLRAHDSRLKIKLLVWNSRLHFLKIAYTNPIIFNLQGMAGLQALRIRPSSEIPDLIKILDQNISDGSRACTASVLGSIGPQAERAVPALLRVAASTNELECADAIDALGEIHPRADTVIPVLIKALHIPSEKIRWHAAYAIGIFHKDAKSAVPALEALLHDPNLNANPDPYPPLVSLRAEIEHALQEVAPETYARVVTNAAPAPAR